MTIVKNITVGIPSKRVTGSWDINNLIGVNTTGKTNGDILVYDSGTSKYVTTTLAGQDGLAFTWDSANDKYTVAIDSALKVSSIEGDSNNIYINTSTGQTLHINGQILADSATFGRLRTRNYSFPLLDGAQEGQAIVTDGNGNLSFAFAGQEGQAVVVSQMQDLNDVQDNLNNFKYPDHFLLWDSSFTTYDSSGQYRPKVFGDEVHSRFASSSDLTYDSATGRFSITATGVTAGTYGSATQIPVLTISAEGQIDSAGLVSVAGVSSTTYDSATGVLTINTADGNSFLTTLHDSDDRISEIRNAISSSGDLSYNSTTGVFSFDVEDVYTKSNFDSDFDLRISETDLVDSTDVINVLQSTTFTTLTVDNVNVDGNTVSTTSGDLILNPTTNLQVTHADFVDTRIPYVEDASGTLATKSTFTFDDATDTLSVTNATIDSAAITTLTTGNITVDGNVVPALDSTYDLGSATNKWRELHLSGQSIYLGNIVLKDENGTLLVTSSGGSPVAVDLSSNTTDSLAEGSTNLYYTDARVRAALSAGGDLSYNSSTGEFSIDVEQIYTSVNFDSDLDAALLNAITQGRGVSYNTADNTINIDSTGVVAGNYGSATQIPVISINEQGQIDSAGTVTVAGVSSVAFDSASYKYTISTADGGSFEQMIHTRIDSGQAGTFGSASAVPIVTVNQFGLIDSVTTVAVAGVESALFDSTTGDYTINLSSGGTVVTRLRDSADIMNRARNALQVTDAGGDGSLSYDSNTGVFTYTGPSAAEARAHFTGGTGVTILSGEVAIGQAVGTSDNVAFNSVSVNTTNIFGQTGGGLSINNDQTKGDASQSILNVVSEDSSYTAGVAIGVKNQIDHVIGVRGNTTSNELVIGLSDTTGTFTVKNNVGTAPFNLNGGTDLFTIGSSGIVNVTSTVEATNKTSGAFVVAGGIAADKNIRAQDFIASGNVQASGTLSGNLQASALSSRSTTDLSEGTNLYYTDARVNSYVSANIVTTDIAEGTNLYYTDARADSAVRSGVSANDGGGDGSFAYNSNTGEFTYTGPSPSEVRAHFSSGTGVTYNSGTGAISIGQAIGIADSVEFGGLTVPGTVTIGGDLNVSGGYNVASNNDLRVTNALIKLADSSVQDIFDIGVVGRYSQDAGVTIRRAGFFRDATNGEWYAFDNLIQDDLDSNPAAQTINRADPSFELGTWNYKALRGQYLGFDSDFAAFSSNYTQEDSSFTAVNAGRYAISTTDGPVTVTLPASPTTGDYVRLIDVSNWATENSVTLDRNGETIEGYSDNFELDLGQSIIELIYINSSWQVYSSIGQRGAQGPKGDSAEVANFASPAQSIAFSIALG
jgi:hypothetical protein